MLSLIPLLTWLLNHRDCRTFFLNKAPSLICGNFIHSLSGIAAITTFTLSNSFSLIIDKEAEKSSDVAICS